jgi:hypothetical protein
VGPVDKHSLRCMTSMFSAALRFAAGVRAGHPITLGEGKRRAANLAGPQGALVADEGRDLVPAGG